MKLKTKLSIYLVLFVFLSCRNEKVASLSHEKYYYEKDSCKNIQILNSEKIILRQNCEEHATSKSVLKQKLNGELIELYCNELTYSIDAIDAFGGNYISAYDKNKNKCFGLHILEEQSVWVVTPLKQGERIDFHFTVPLVYIKANSKVHLEFKEHLIIQVQKEAKEGLFYIAYDQPHYSNSKKDKNGNTIIELNEKTNCYKTDLVINPSFYAFKKYQVEWHDASNPTSTKLPILYHVEYAKYLNMSDLEKDIFHKNRKMEDKFIVVYRFNPGRERVVDKLYKEKIQGQVQSFELVYLK